jgi:hypothetical protein
MDPASTEIIGRLDGIQRNIARLETALIGDPAVGHKGIVNRLETLELLNGETAAAHQGIEDRTASELAKVAARVDALAEDWRKFKYMAAGAMLGAGVAGGGVGAWVASLLS